MTLIVKKVYWYISQISGERLQDHWSSITGNSPLRIKNECKAKEINLSLNYRKFPELFKWFKDFLGYKEHGGTIEAIPQNATGKERISGELAMEIGRNSYIDLFEETSLSK